VEKTKAGFTPEVQSVFATEVAKGKTPLEACRFIARGCREPNSLEEAFSEQIRVLVNK
jgi:hypothetical protein